MRARLLLLLAGSAALGGCAYGFGGYGSPYSGLSIGVGYGSGYGGCYDPYYGGYGYGSGYGGYGYNYGSYGSCGYSSYGYGDPYYGWYGDYYYPGSGYYVYDSYRRPHVWSDTQRRYWTHRRDRALSTTRSTSTSQQQTVLRDNWSGFNQRDRNGRRTDTDTKRARRSDDTRPR